MSFNCVSLLFLYCYCCWCRWWWLCVETVFLIRKVQIRVTKELKIQHNAPNCFALPRFHFNTLFTEKEVFIFYYLLSSSRLFVRHSLLKLCWLDGMGWDGMQVQKRKKTHQKATDRLWKLNGEKIWENCKLFQMRIVNCEICNFV